MGEIRNRDYKTNEKYYQSKVNNLTDEDFEILNPDTINNHIFWELAPSLDRGAICGSPNYNHNNMNELNLTLLEYSGALSYIKRSWIPGNCIFEIGSGFGSFRKEVPSYIEYYGIDNCPRFKNVYQTNEDGTCTSFIKSQFGRTFDFVVCSNVFQHLSIKQKQHYIDLAHFLLKDNGCFIVNDTTYTIDNKINFSYTAGQFIKLSSIEDLKNMMCDKFDILCGNINYVNRTVTYILRKINDKKV